MLFRNKFKFFFTAAALFIFLGVSPAFALPANFVDTEVAAGLTLPTDFVFAPDGRVFISEKNGKIAVFKEGQLLESPALTMAVSSGGDRGLLSITLDPDFSANGFIYLLYTSSGNHQRISRFKISGDIIDPLSELVLLENPRSWSGFLNAGTVRFGPDGKLYASFGSDGLGAVAQDLASLEGKFIRLNKDGSIPADNPFASTPGAQKSIYSYGFRNPWKFNFDQQGKALIGDVGEDHFEKIVRAEAGANFGWPNSEGDCRPNCGGVAPPLYVYPHTTNGAAVVGGAVYVGTQFPTSFQNNYFFGDYVGGYLKNISFNESGGVAAVNDFATDLGALAGINNGPDGCLYYLTIFPGVLKKICFGISSVAVTAASDKNSGNLPLVVQFSATGTGPDLSYLWDFGDGETSTAQNPSHTYTAQGVYQAKVIAGNSIGSASVNITIWAGYLPPTVTIDSPAAGTTWNGGNSISYQASASDPQDGTLRPANFFWKIIFHHNTHIHPPEEVVGAAGGTFSISDHSHTAATDIFYEFQVIATNSVGLSATASRFIYPNLINFRLDTNPAGLGLLLDDQPIITSYQALAIPGFLRKISAPSPQFFSGTSYGFDFWSNGGTQTQTITMPAVDITLTANFSPVTDITFVSLALLERDIYTTGDTLSGSIKITGNISGDAMVDMEIYKSAEQENQMITTASFVAGQETIIPFSVAAPGTPGAYTIKIGVFSSDWTTLYHWNDTAKIFEVIGDAQIPLSFTASGQTDKANYSTSEAPAITSRLKATQDITNVILDTEIWGASGKIAQDIIAVDLSAHVEFSSLMNAPLLAAGAYTIKIGVFSSDWTTLYKWIDKAAAFTVADTTPPPTLAFAVSASMPKSSFAPGETAAVTTKITATSDLAHVLIDTEIYDLNGTGISQNLVSTDLLANSQHQTIWNTTLPVTDGTYILKVGIFADDWSRMYFWKNNAFQFTVGAAPGDPVPGKVYPVIIYAPTDGATVSGLVEIRAAIPELDINSYNIGWKTGTGEFFTMDTDPVTQGFKHAWIDFSPWTWHSDNNYLLEFQARDLSENIIGHQAITVQVAH